MTQTNRAGIFNPNRIDLSASKAGIVFARVCSSGGSSSYGSRLNSALCTLSSSTLGKKALNCLRLGSRIDAVSSRLETAVRMNTVTKSMKGVVKGMDKGLASMDVDKISAIMDKFEKQFEDLDVKAAYMDTAMNATTASATPVDQVDELVKMVADENNLELGEEFGNLLPVGKLKEPTAKVQEEEAPVADDLEARLANLRG